MAQLGCHLSAGYAAGVLRHPASCVMFLGTGQSFGRVQRFGRCAINVGVEIHTLDVWWLGTTEHHMD